METPIQIAISPSDRSSGRPEPLQMSWIATGMAAAGEKIKKTKLTTEGEAKSKN
jgi:hypothetical protein